jgi:BirA family biotin operon repressor/biotin-[acetyl-CoA-carboxylase] ligase
VEQDLHQQNSLFPEQIRKSLTSRWLGHVIYLHEELGSTNLTAQELAREGAAEGTAVLAEQQRRGRGRRGRSWHSPAGVGIYCSIILRPAISPNRAQLVTLGAAVAVARVIAFETALSPQIKWPNDILIKDRKVAGILTESRGGPVCMDYLVVGMGINVNQTAADFQDALMAEATSLRLELGRPVERQTLLVRLFSELEGIYEKLQQGESAFILEQWRQLSPTLGQRVVIDRGTVRLEGTAVDVNAAGALLVRRDDGSLEVIQTGDVVHLRRASSGRGGTVDGKSEEQKG